MPESGQTVEIDGEYRALREEAGLVDRSERGMLVLRGADGAEFLQGQLTNDVEALEPETGCYAALLDRKGHIQADVRVLRLGNGDFWLDTEPEATATLFRHLETYKIGREVEVVDESGEWAIHSLAGPASHEIAGSGPLPDEHAQRSYERDGVEVLAVATELGVDLITRTADGEAIRKGLFESGAVEVSEDAAEILRVESGRPRFGVEMSAATMPAEAGIEERAIDFEKGCYIGQEPVARLHYKGRPNRHLRGLRFSALPVVGEPLVFGDKQVGEIASACISPALGPIGLAVVRREAQPGDRLLVGEGEVTAEVTELPLAR